MPLLNVRRQLMKMTIGVCAILLLGSAVSPAWAAGATEIDGLVMDQTTTKVGHDFALAFNLVWEPLEGVDGYTVVIEDQADPKLGIWINLEVNDTLVFRALLKPSPDDISAAAEDAAGATKMCLIDMKLTQQLLEKEGDLLGNGIH
jgi:curli production assembly/transport component CsgE